MYWKNLDVWKRSHNLTLNIFKITKNFPGEEKYGLISQLRRAAYSVPLNIVEGHTRKSTKEFIQFLHIARGSLEELRYLILLCSEVNYCSERDCNLVELEGVRISRMLNALIRTMSKKISS